MNDPEKVRVVMDEVCDKMAIICLCREICETCPLSSAKWENINNMRDLFDKEL